MLRAREFILHLCEFVGVREDIHMLLNLIIEVILVLCVCVYKSGRNP